MSTDMILEIISTSSEHTERVGEALGRHLKGGEVIELLSDVGGGKTTLVRGLAHGAGSDDPVASPTFTISKLYAAPRFTINHLDLYRLGDEPGVIKQELQETLHNATDVVVVEWAAAVADVLPTSRITIEIHYHGNNERRLRITAPQDLAYTLKDLEQ